MESQPVSWKSTGRRAADIKFLLSTSISMDKSLKGRVVIDQMDDHSKKLLKDFLIEFNPQYWENAEDELKAAFD